MIDLEWFFNKGSAYQKSRFVTVDWAWFNKYDVRLKLKELTSQSQYL